MTEETSFKLCSSCNKLVPDSKAVMISIYKAPLYKEFALCEKCYKVTSAIWKRASKGEIDIEDMLEEETEE